MRLDTSTAESKQVTYIRETFPETLRGVDAVDSLYMAICMVKADQQTNHTPGSYAQ